MIAAPMARHDCGIVRFREWWVRALRGGHACAESAWRNGRREAPQDVRRVWSITLWAILLPIVLALALWLSPWIALLLFAGYPLLWWRIARARIADGSPGADGRVYASFLVIGKFAEALGLLRYLGARLSGRRSRIIEYKRTTARKPNA